MSHMVRRRLLSVSFEVASVTAIIGTVDGVQREILAQIARVGIGSTIINSVKPPA